MVFALRLVADAASSPPSSNLIARVEGVMGARPVIRGTRITVDAVKGRVSGGETVDDLTIDDPGVAREAFEAAVAYDPSSAEPRPASAARRDE